MKADPSLAGALDHVLIGSEGHYTQHEVAERAGIDFELARRFWRAMGFPDVPGEEAIFTDADVTALADLARMLDSGIVDPEVAMQMTRVMGQSLSRVADAQVAALRDRVESILVPDAEPAQVAEAVLMSAAVLLPNVEPFVTYQWRRHLAAAARRATMNLTHETEGEPAMAVGFADLVGFTAVSQQLDERQLADLVGAFEHVAYDTVAGEGGRIVKMIGDEAMFVADDPAAAANIGLALAEAYGHDETTPDVRVGLACGPVLTREGDYFGPTVNLASRIVNIAYVGAVVVSSDIHDALEGDDRFAFRAVRPRRLKGIGLTQLWALRRPGESGRRLPSAVAERMKARRAH